MPYRAPFEADAYYHVYNRGNNRQPIFFERENYLYFLRQLKKYLVAEGEEIIAYCLMPNHYHLLIHIGAQDFGKSIQPLALSYTKAINKRYGRTGTLFQGRFQAGRVDREEYLLHLSRYIHANPVMAGLVDKPEDWEFSSYRDYIGLRGGKLPNSDVVLSQFGTLDAYRVFVEAYVESDWEIIQSLTFE